MSPSAAAAGSSHRSMSEMIGDVPLAVDDDHDPHPDVPQVCPGHLSRCLAYKLSFQLRTVQLCFAAAIVSNCLPDSFIVVARPRFPIQTSYPLR